MPDSPICRHTLPFTQINVHVYVIRPIYLLQVINGELETALRRFKPIGNGCFEVISPANDYSDPEAAFRSSMGRDRNSYIRVRHVEVCQPLPHESDDFSVI